MSRWLAVPGAASASPGGSTFRTTRVEPLGSLAPAPGGVGESEQAAATKPISTTVVVLTKNRARSIPSPPAGGIRRWSR